MQINYIENSNTAKNFHPDFHDQYQQSELAGPHILLVDDDPDQLLMFEYLIKSYGCNVLSASSGMEALDALCCGLQVDLIVTDAMMPDINGDSLIKAVRSSLTYNKLPIIVLTARCAEALNWMKKEGVPDMLCLKQDAREELQKQIFLLLNSNNVRN